MSSPYSDLPPRAFWRQGVAERQPGDPGDVFSPRFAVAKTDRIMTAGSCFAQHVGRTLREAGFNVLDVEPAPRQADPATAAKFGYGMYTARYGNIYTVRQLVQLFDEAYGNAEPADRVWEKDGRYFDAQRPNTEPEGLDSPETVLRLRADHLARVRGALEAADLFVFTFGLTEAWVHKASGTVYPTAPGTLAGSFDPETYAFKNYRFSEILSDFLTFREKLRAVNPGVRFLITTSPVPLTATASGKHVEVATTYSKSVLRSVCGELYDTLDDVDYFPSYEIITSQRAGGGYYESNLRSVASHGVQTAMSVFMNAHGIAMERPDVRVGRLADYAGEEATTTDEMSPKELRALLRQRKAEMQAKRRERLGRKPGGGKGPRAGQGGAAAEERRAARRLARQQQKAAPASQADDDVVCEDALLEAFNK